MIHLSLISRLERRFAPMRRETDDDLEIEKAEPVEDERELGSPVGIAGDSSSPWYPWEVTP